MLNGCWFVWTSSATVTAARQWCVWVVALSSATAAASAKSGYRWLGGYLNSPRQASLPHGAAALPVAERILAATRQMRRLDVASPRAFRSPPRTLASDHSTRTDTLQKALVDHALHTATVLPSMFVPASRSDRVWSPSARARPHDRAASCQCSAVVRRGLYTSHVRHVSLKLAARRQASRIQRLVAKQIMRHTAIGCTHVSPQALQSN